MFTANKGQQMQTTDRDWASKDWLRRDNFQLVDPDLAIFLLIVGGFAGFVFRSFL